MNKKIASIVFAGIMLVSLISITNAAEPPSGLYSAYGYVTINGNPAPAGIEIILSIEGRVDRKDITDAQSRYIIDFPSLLGETATFIIHIGSQYFTPTTNPLFHIEHPSPYGYYLNLTLDSTEPMAPVADAGGPYYAQVGQQITFSGAGSYDIDGTITGYRWDWTNDGTYDTVWLSTPTTTYSYTTIGVYTVKLEVQDNDELTDDDTTTVTITTEPPINNPPFTPSNPTPINNAVDQSIYVDLGWNGGDPDTGDTVTYEIYFGTETTPPYYTITSAYPSTQTSIINSLPELQKNTQYYWKINALDNHGETTLGPIWSFTTITFEDDQSPTKVTNLIVTDAKDGKLNIAWDMATDNVAVDHYEIYRDDFFITNQTTTSYQDIGLTNGQSYTYKIRAVDISGNKGEFSDPVSGTPTQTESGGGGGGDTIPPTTENKPPIADASAGEPYQGFTGTALIFDGTKSSDSGGHIISWKWTFGDGTNGSGETVSHTYSNPGIYTVILTVTDNQSAKDTDETTATILTPNNPPKNPTITGPTSGDKNTDYEFIAVSTDADDDDIQYLFTWDDGQTTTTEFIPNGTSTQQTHQWTNPGIYTLTVQAYDNLTYSGATEHTISIDAEEVGTIGYLIDENNDGVFDSFYSYSLDNTTAVEHQTDGTYLIDEDGDGTWDYIYDPTTKTLTEYQKGEEKLVEENTMPFYILLFLLAVLFGFLLIVLVKKKKKTDKQQPQQSTPPTAEEPQKPKKTQSKTKKTTKKK